MENNQIIGDTTDRISELPEFIAHHILSLLDSPKERVRMSVLSKNWFARTASFPILDFNINKFLPLINPFDGPFNPAIDRSTRNNFFKYVEYTTSRFCLQSVTSAHTLNLVTHLEHPKEADIIDRCLELILKRAVKVLVIDVMGWPMYCVPDILLSSACSLTSLELSECEVPLSLMADDVKFNSLKGLVLYNTLIDEEVINRLIASCPLLEKLNVRYCYGFERFCVSGLQYLQKVSFYFMDEVEEINIEAPNMYYLELGDSERRGLPSMNLASCEKLTTLIYSGYPSPTSEGLADLSSSFPVLEDLHLYLPGHCKTLKLSSHSVRKFVLCSNCDLEDIDMNTPNLLLFNYEGSSHISDPLVGNAAPSKARMECYPDKAVDTIWFEKLRRFLDRSTIGFKELKLCISAVLIDVEELKVIQPLPFKLGHVELETNNIQELSVYLAVVDAILWCCCPRSLTLKSSFGCANFEEWSHSVKFICEKLLQQEDQGRTNIEIVLSSSSQDKKHFSDFNSLLTASPHLKRGGTITFVKKEVIQEEQDSRIVERAKLQVQSDQEEIEQIQDCYPQENTEGDGSLLSLFWKKIVRILRIYLILDGRVQRMLGHYQTLSRAGSWFLVLRQASHDFTPEGRIAWVDVEGIPFKFWSGKTFKKIATKWGELLDVDDHDEMSFSTKRICIHTKIVPTNVEREDNRNSDGAKTNSTGSRKFKMSEIPRTGGSILSVMEEISDSIGNSWRDSSLVFGPNSLSNKRQHEVRDKSGKLWDYLSPLSNQRPDEVGDDGLEEEVKKLQNQGVNIFDYIRIKIGNGDNTSFWKDKWHNEGVLKDLFSRLYALERHQNVTIQNVTIRRNPRSGVEEFQLDNLSRLVSTITLSSAVD
ncbi:F-box domain containing protein, partial [Tanacetum coccineum]